ncbi:fatty acid desaturase family protein [Nostoc sp. WHI]|uniref:fatty acid desaturase family protein n=1 Tax=Nostoc sp. WHI TaxID=2650611 RepID=UPI0018C7A44E|nr:fatty acid desaturase [Nostoc sp. WHI]MBG1266117.1 fatty acid desaturase [Nostoc sp. WHI]
MLQDNTNKIICDSTISEEDSAELIEPIHQELIQVNKTKKPKIPAQMYTPSIVGTSLFIFYACTMYLLPGYLAYLVASLVAPVLLRILLIIPLVLLAGNGLLLMGYLGHDGIHFNLHRNRVVSVIIGCFFSSSIIGYLEMGFATTHWNHHRYTNQNLDPDVAHFSKFNNFWMRLLFARITLNLIFFKDTLKMALVQPLPYLYKLPFQPQTLSLLSWLNIGFSLVWLSLYIKLTIDNPLLGLTSIALPGLVVLTGSGFVPYLQHSGTSEGFLHNARTLTSPIWTILTFGGNYHLEHHMYPNVPIYRLPYLHRCLKEQKLYEQDKEIFISRNFLSSLLYALLNYPQGSAEIKVD